MRFQVRTLNVPRRGALAFLPMPVSIGTAATNGQNIVTGSPGTALVPSPRPAALVSNDLGGPKHQPSAVSPDVFAPSIYVSRINRTQLFPGALLTNETPAPVTAIGAVPRTLWRKPVIGGTKVTAARRPFTVWQTYGGKAG